MLLLKQMSLYFGQCQLFKRYFLKNKYIFIFSIFRICFSYLEIYDLKREKKYASDKKFILIFKPKSLLENIITKPVL